MFSFFNSFKITRTKINDSETKIIIARGKIVVVAHIFFEEKKEELFEPSGNAYHVKYVTTESNIKKHQIQQNKHLYRSELFSFFLLCVIFERREF